MSRRLVDVRDRIAEAGGDPEAVRVVAVTKGFPAAAVEAALACGLADVGENYAQELVAKSEALGEPSDRRSAPRWHFLGRVQRNKVAKLAPLVACWQGIARREEGAAIARRRAGSEVLVEVDTTGRPERPGRRPEEVPRLVRELLDEGLSVRGLMTLAPRDPAEAAACFTTVARLADELSLAERSMGMTDDLELAVARGSTMVRVGRALFGPRRSPGFPPGF